ncbi:hypothetical protein SETIT_1G168700v2 [Setaria italica]|uniref:Uncharacterized protein n=1 Tax=Setaria italica TaxID=4555 RepID=A0A368PL42_SETIT|nr:atherin-like [Setaria italica]RCV06511.1 hypothetical protein SETIT_1G168700v2 [Setaria italica]
MKTLCPKPGKGGKIHPSPAEDPIAAAFRLLPAAILVLVAGLTPEDQRVLAHLVTRSFLVGWDAATAPPPEQARGGRRRRGHPPTVGCLCFECYGSFWTRWGCSPQHDRIHAALEAFEEHLNAAESAAASSSAATPPSSKRRDRGKRSRAAAATPPPPTPPPPPPIQSRPESPEPPAEAEVVPEPSSPPPPSCPPPPAPAACPSENKENVPEAAPAEAKSEECGGEVAAEAEEERKRGWADVMGGVLNPRRWGIWSPAVESAT